MSCSADIDFLRISGKIYQKENEMKKALNLYLDEEVIEKLEQMANYAEESKSKFLTRDILVVWECWVKHSGEKEFNRAVTTNDKEIK
jgi:hypothetical protein